MQETSAIEATQAAYSRDAVRCGDINDTSYDDVAPPRQILDLSSTALLLDVDGTILDLAATPSSVEVTPGLRASLGALHARCGGALALVSGRLIENLDRLFVPLRLPAIGGHGAQVRLHVDGQICRRTGPVIGSALRRLVDGIARDKRIVVEDKGSSLAIHYRLAPELEPSLELKLRAMVDAVAGDELELLHGKLVLELKSAGVSKGEAVRELMQSAPFAGRMPVFVGDDVTDQSVLDVLPGLSGIGYSVERAMAGASGVFRAPSEVRAWLADLSRR